MLHITITTLKYSVRLIDNDGGSANVREGWWCWTSMVGEQMSDKQAEKGWQ